jgi:hypothetical protein
MNKKHSSLCTQSHILETQTLTKSDRKGVISVAQTSQYALKIDASVGAITSFTGVNVLNLLRLVGDRDVTKLSSGHMVV